MTAWRAPGVLDKVSSRPRPDARTRARRHQPPRHRDPHMGPRDCDGPARGVPRRRRRDGARGVARRSCHPSCAKVASVPRWRRPRMRRDRTPRRLPGSHAVTAARERRQPRGVGTTADRAAQGGEGAEPPATTTSRRGGGRFRGCPSTRSTCSTARTVRRRFPSSSASTASCSPTTSCSDRTGTRAARAARSSPIASTARASISPIATSRSCVSPRAPYEKLAAYRERMGWTTPFFSSVRSDFNHDFHVSFTGERDRGRSRVQLHEVRASVRGAARHRARSRRPTTAACSTRTRATNVVSIPS